MDETHDKKNSTEQSISDSEVAIEEMEGLIAQKRDFEQSISNSEVAKRWRVQLPN